jgi:hypothetical protein
MNGWMIAGIAALVILFLLIRAITKNPGKPTRPNYQKLDFLFSPEERFFFTALKQAVEESHEVFGKIPVADILQLRRFGQPDAARQSSEINIHQRFDFVLCKKPDLAVTCALQLVEHSVPGRKSRSSDPLQAICESVGLPLIKFETEPLYDPATIRQTIIAAIHKEPMYLIETDGRKEPRFSNLENLDL